MKKLVNLSLEERFERLDVLSSEQIAKVYGGGTDGDITFNPTIKFTPAPTITLPPITFPKTLPPITISIGKGGGSIGFPIKI